jgi:hypothetical protein
MLAFVVRLAPSISAYSWLCATLTDAISPRCVSRCSAASNRSRAAANASTRGRGAALDRPALVGAQRRNVPLAYCRHWSLLNRRRRFILDGRADHRRNEALREREQLFACPLSSDGPNADQA